MNILKVIFSISFLAALNTKAAFEDKNSIQLMYGPSTHSLDLKSDLFTASQDYVQGAGYLVSYVGHTKDGFLRTEINLSELENKFLTSSALTPAEIKVKNQKAEIAMLGIATTIDQHRFFRVGVGYSFLKQIADQTTPNILAVNTEIHAMELKFKYDLYKAHDFVIDVGLGLGLPFRYLEYGVQSGVNVKSTILNGNVDLQYYLNAGWSILGKLQYSLVQTVAEGSGSRGTLNSTERKQTFFLPIGFSYDF